MKHSHKENTITFTLVYHNGEHIVHTRKNGYHTLMTLISDHLCIPGFGICSGMGSCGTCTVEICEKFSQAKRIAFSCSIQVNDDLANTRIIVPEEFFKSRGYINEYRSQIV